MIAKSEKDSKKTGASTSNKAGVGTGSTAGTAKASKSKNSTGRDMTSKNERNKKDEPADDVMRPMDASHNDSRNSSTEGRGRRND